MQELGLIKGLGYDGNLLVLGKLTPKLNSKVVDNSKKIVGTVTRVFGPVDSPYISIKVPKNQKPTLDIVGKVVYLRENSK
ncbi:MAG: H/ACA RNA-protein complex protein Gar1 [Thermoplasmata archaeon]|nr:MAG: H/ACA RNA-protein complex protein Gar1 [Thermoplasmata archaeon]